MIRASLLYLLTASAVCGACTPAQQNQNDVLVVALSAAPNTLDPRFATDAVGMRIDDLLFTSIVRLGPHLTIIGEAARSWTFNDNTFVFQLQPDLTFSDGQPVTASDLEFSFAQFMSPKSPYSSSLSCIDKLEVRYDQHERYLKLHLKSYSADFLTELAAVKILPQKAVLASGDDFAKSLVGSGSFSLEQQTADEIVLRARPHHALATPKMQTVVFKVIRDEMTRYLKTLHGDIDISQSEIPPSKVSELHANPDLQVFTGPGLSMSYILINFNDPKLQSLAARQAISLALNRDEIVRYKLAGFASPATSILTPASPFFYADLPKLEFNLEKAKALVRNLGLADLTLKTSNVQVAIENGKVITNQLTQAGLTTKLQSFEWGTFYNDLKQGHFQLATLSWVGVADPGIYKTALHSHELPPTGRNRGHYHNEKLDKLLDAGILIANQQIRLKHYQEIQKIVLDDLPIIPLWYNQDIAIVHKKVKGYVLPLNGEYSGFTQVWKE